MKNNFYMELNDLRGKLLTLQTDWDSYTSELEKQNEILKKAVEFLASDDVNFMLDGDVVKVARQALKEIGEIDEK